MEKFRDAKYVAKMAIPLGVVGVFLMILGYTAESNVLFILGLLPVFLSGGMWTMHGIAEDQDPA